MPKKSYVKKREYQAEMKKKARQGLINRDTGDFVTEGQFRLLPAKSDTTFSHYIAGHGR
jgi:hypothetical protein